MPLYNNILLSKSKIESKNEPKQSANASMKFLQDHLLSKKRQSAPISNLKTQKLPKTRSHEANDKIILESSLHKPSENDWNPEDEYDPMVPNSYEVLQAEFLKAREQRLAERKSFPINIKKHIPNLLDVLDELEDESESMANKKTRGTAIAPPPSFNSTTTTLEDRPVTKTVVNKPANFDGSSVAAKIMSKMGYKAGQGLGKDEQGISSPLEVEKIGVNSGKIISTSESCSNQLKSSSEVKPKPEPKDDMKKLLMDSTRVILLKNMVGPGEVDDELEAETKEECKKYGDVIKCLIYEIPNKKVPDEEAVRIFVEFCKVESAIKAVSDLNGRYFGGRVVGAFFYSVERFNRYELGPEITTKK